MRSGKGQRIEKLFESIFFVCALTSVMAVGMICTFLLARGVPAMGKAGLWDFILGTKWSPTDIPPSFGIFPMILGSVYITLGAVLIGMPIGVLTAVFMARCCPRLLYRFIGPAVELLAGIPSVVYGFFGLMVLVPLVRTRMAGDGMSIFTASLLLGIMILPTIITVTEAALRALPEHYYQGALALGATHQRAIFAVEIPAAASGILAAVVLGVGRAIGETMAVVMVAGGQARMPRGIFRGIRTLTANIVTEMAYAADLHREMLIATGVILFLFILMINLTFALLKRRITP